jgi:esterase/lipase
MDAVGSEDKELLILEEASHILPVSSEKETVLAAISDFIARLLSKTDDHAIPVHESR